MSATAQTSRSVDRALTVIGLLAEARPLTLSELAAEADLPVSTTSRIIATLEERDFAVRDDAGRYSPGSRLYQFGALALGNLSLYELVEPHLMALADLTNETAYLALPQGDGAAVYVRQVESPLAIRHASWMGRSINIAGTALGKALGGRTGDRGHALSRATKVEPEATAAAAPIRDASGQIVAAISVIGPSFRIDDEALEKFGEAVGERARQISAMLGHEQSSADGVADTDGH